MLKNTLIVAWRNLRRDWVVSLINVAGLGMGIACCIAIVIFVLDELSYDRWNEQAERVFRVHVRALLASAETNVATSAPPLAAAMAQDFPEVAAVTRVFGGREEHVVRIGSRRIREKKIYWVDSTFAKVFTVPFIEGNPARALNRSNTAVITETSAKVYFGGDDPMGRVFSVEGSGATYEITGVVKDCPPNAHFHYDVLAAFSTFEESRTPYWLQLNLYTYVALRKGASPDSLQARLNRALKTYMGAQIRQATGASYEQLEMKGARYEYLLQPLASIHLSSHLESELEPNGEVSSVYIFSSIAAAILLLAIINFMNLATARVDRRAKEIGIRKALGSQRGQLVRQFLAESVLLSAIAVGVAAGLVLLFIPFLGSLAGKPMQFQPLGNITTMLLLLCTAAGVGALAGLYPALSLSSLSPVQMLKHGVRRGSRGTGLRNGLVVFQFAVSIILIVGTLIIRDQLGYMRSKDLGFTKEQVITIRVSDIDDSHRALLREELLKSSRVITVSNSTSLPGSIDAFDQSTFRMEEAPPEDARQLYRMFCDTHFAEAFRLTMADGEFFGEHHAPGAPVAVINEAAERLLRLQHPIGSQLMAMGMSAQLYTIVGVVKDFHFESLRQPVRPLVLQLFPIGMSGSFLSVRVIPGPPDETLNDMKAAWDNCGGGLAFTYSFLDENLDALYKAEQRTTAIVGLFSLLALCIACLGLFGLATFVTEQRTKEIGIRKVLGAAVSDVVMLLTKEFVKWVLVAMAIALPLAWLVMDRWLQEFAYRINVGFGSFVLAGALALAVAFITVCGQALKAALTNPVDNLRYE